MDKRSDKKENKKLEKNIADISKDVSAINTKLNNIEENVRNIKDDIGCQKENLDDKDSKDYFEARFGEWKIYKNRKWIFGILTTIWGLSIFLNGFIQSKNTSVLDYDLTVKNIEYNYTAGKDSVTIHPFSSPKKIAFVDIKLEFELNSGSVKDIYLVTNYLIEDIKTEGDKAVTRPSYDVLRFKIGDSLQHVGLLNSGLPLLKPSVTLDEHILVLGNSSSYNMTEEKFNAKKDLLLSNSWLVIVDNSGNYYLDSLSIISDYTFGAEVTVDSEQYAEKFDMIKGPKAINGQVYDYSYVKGNQVTDKVHDELWENCPELLNEEQKSKGCQKSKLPTKAYWELKEDENYIEERLLVKKYIHEYVLDE